MNRLNASMKHIGMCVACANYMQQSYYCEVRGMMNGNKISDINYVCIRVK